MHSGNRLHSRWARIRTGRRGQALVEFAVVSFALYLLIAFALTMGRLLFCGMIAQQAVEVAARELSRTPMPATALFEEDALNNSGSEFSQLIYSEDWLAIDISPWLAAPGGMSLLEYLDTLSIPITNRILVPAMIVQRVQGTGQTLLRYPGALVTSLTAPSGFTVEVPLIIDQPEAGGETIQWVRVIEEIDTEESFGDNTGASPDPFSITSAERGLVALRINYPFQSAVASQRATPPHSGPAMGAVVADEGMVTSVNATKTGGTPVDAGEPAAPYAGASGLGKQFAFAQTIRPYRRVLTLRAAFRREVFE